MSTAKRQGAQIFRFTQVKLKIYPPPRYHSEAKAGNGIQLYIYIYIYNTVTLCSVSFGVEQVDRSVMFCKFLYDFIMLLLLLLLCITPQHIYVVVVVVIVYFYWSFVSISRNKRALFFK